MHIGISISLPDRKPPTRHHPPCVFYMWEWCAQLLTGRCHLLRFAKLFFVSFRFSMNLSSLNPLSAASATPLTPPWPACTHCRMRLLPFSFTKHSPLSPLSVAERNMNSPRPPAPRWAPSLLPCAPTESSVWHGCVCLCECPFVDSAWKWRGGGWGWIGGGAWVVASLLRHVRHCGCECAPHIWGQHNRP